MKNFDAQKIEKKWQKYWEEKGTYRTPYRVEGKENFYTLSEFAYPSGNLHVGHWYAFAVPDIYARYKRMNGYNVLYPIGFDAFGLPAENAAIKRGLDPKDWTYKNMEYMTQQLKSMGASFDWERKIATSDPEYYKWTQWMFTQFYKNGIVEQIDTKANWCDSCKTVLANEQVVGGKCERCDSDVIQKDMKQWALKITDFADELIEDLDTLPWDESIKQAQREWIGRKEGSEISFPVAFNKKEKGNVVYHIIEKSIDVPIEELSSFGELSIKDDFDDWGYFYELKVEASKEKELRDFLSKHLLEKNPDGGSWYADSVGTSNYVIFKDKIINVSSKEGLDNFYQHGESLGIPREQLDIILPKEKPKKILLATNNESKKERVIKLFKQHGVDIEILSPHDLGIETVDVEEDGNLEENAVKKARAYLGKTDLPILANDASFFIDGVNLDPVKVKRNALEGVDEKNLKQEEIAEKILSFYKNIASEKGGKVDGYWHEIWTLVLPDGETKTQDAKREIVLTDTVHGEVDSYFPIRSLYYSKTTGKYHSDSNEEDYKKEMEPVFQTLSTLLSEVANTNSKIDIFTTRADTLFGATYVVLAPEHTLVQDLKEKIENWDEVEAYLKEVEKKSDLERQQNKTKTGVQLKGVFAINPATKKEIPIFIADYVLANFGTGAVMAVPTHDERDAEFALKYNLPFKFVVLPSAGDEKNPRPLVTFGEDDFIKQAGEGKKGVEKIRAEWNAMYDLLNEVHKAGGVLPEGKRFGCDFEGKLINSPTEKEQEDAVGVFNGKTSEEAKKEITEKVGGKMTKTYRLRDWGISRQRYWGTPIPIVYDPEGNAHTIPEEHLPWMLPEDVDHRPDGTAPLARSKELKERTERIFGKGWEPEVDTMDTFVDSSWYFYRYLDPHNDESFADVEKRKLWMPIDMYFGGAEHTTMHLLYSRFWTKALHKIGLVDEKEPYKGRLNRGLILGPDGLKMSKSKGNVIDPDEVVSHVGADTVRMYLAFIGPFNEPGNYPWDPNGVVGVRRFIERVYGLSEKIRNHSSDDLLRLTHKTVKKMTEDVERLKLNTAISSMMVWTNRAEKEENIGRNEYEMILKMFASFAPHIAEEIWQEELEHSESIHLSPWPQYDEQYMKDETITLAVQVNGKVRAQMQIDADADEEKVREQALALPEIQKWIDGKEIKKFIYVRGKIVNVVV